MVILEIFNSLNGLKMETSFEPHCEDLYQSVILLYKIRVNQSVVIRFLYFNQSINQSIHPSIHQSCVAAFEACLSGVLDAGGSFNMYMFHGGTNFGFMAGANYFEGSHYKPDVTSYGNL